MQKAGSWFTFAIETTQHPAMSAPAKRLRDNQEEPVQEAPLQMHQRQRDVIYGVWRPYPLDADDLEVLQGVHRHIAHALAQDPVNRALDSDDHDPAQVPEDHDDHDPVGQSHPHILTCTTYFSRRVFSRSSRSCSRPERAQGGEPSEAQGGDRPGSEPVGWLSEPGSSAAILLYSATF